MVSEAMVTSKQPQWPRRSNFISDLMQATPITLASTCILPGAVIMVASEAIGASIGPQRLLLTSNLNSVASITHVSMSFLSLSVTAGNLFPGEENKWLFLTSVREAQHAVKNPPLYSSVEITSKNSTSVTDSIVSLTVTEYLTRF